MLNLSGQIGNVQREVSFNTIFLLVKSTRLSSISFVVIFTMTVTASWPGAVSFSEMVLIAHFFFLGMDCSERTRLLENSIFLGIRGPKSKDSSGKYW